MEDWRKDARREPSIVDLDTLVPKEHLLRKIEKVMDYEWLYERLDPYYCHDNGRPGTDPVVLIKWYSSSTCSVFLLCGKPIREFRILSHIGGFGLWPAG